MQQASPRAAERERSWHIFKWCVLFLAVWLTIGYELQHYGYAFLFAAWIYLSIPLAFIPASYVFIYIVTGGFEL